MVLCVFVVSVCFWHYWLFFWLGLEPWSDYYVCNHQPCQSASIHTWLPIHWFTHGQMPIFLFGVHGRTSTVYNINTCWRNVTGKPQEFESSTVQALLLESEYSCLTWASGVSWGRILCLGGAYVLPILVAFFCCWFYPHTPFYHWQEPVECELHIFLPLAVRAKLNCVYSFMWGAPPLKSNTQCTQSEPSCEVEHSEMEVNVSCFFFQINVQMLRLSVQTRASQLCLEVQ